MHGLTFQNWQKILTFDEACERHAMLQDLLAALKTTVSDRTQLRLIAKHMVDAWNECVGLGDPDSVMGSAIRFVVPVEHIPLLRLFSGIPAANLVIFITNRLIATNMKGGDLNDHSVLRSIVTEAWDQFEKFRQACEVTSAGMGFDRSQSWAVVRKLVDDRSGQMAPTMRKIADLAGKMFDAFQYQGIPIKTREPQEIDGVTTGDDLERILDDEAAEFGVNPEALVRFVEGQAVQLEMSGTAVKSRGPMVLVIDESGSMEGSRNIWAKACAIALTRIAVAEARAVKVVHFGTGTEVHDIRPNDPSSMIELAETFVGGGTDIDTALAIALKQVGEFEKQNLQGADIVFITDGVAVYAETHFKTMRARGIDLWTVAIQVDLQRIHQAWIDARGFHPMPGFLFSYARAYVYIDDNTINSRSGDSINVAVKLRQAALDNGTGETDGEDLREI